MLSLLKSLYFTLFIVLICHSHFLTGQVSIEFPVSKIVLQRNHQNKAVSHVRGLIDNTVDSVQIRFEAYSGEGVTRNWKKVTVDIVNKVFASQDTLVAGRYILRLRGYKNGINITNSSVDWVGVGEVFLIIGHSNAQGGFSPSVAAVSPKVVSVSLSIDSLQKYFVTADPSVFEFKFSQLTANSGIAPFSGDSWYWSQLGDLLANRLNMPISFYSAAFGGSNMEQNYKSAYNIPFSHGFINYNLRFPYIITKNILQRFVPYTGLRGVLAHHGINDRANPIDSIKKHFEGVILKSRQDANFASLAWIIPDVAWLNGINNDVVAAQQAVRNTVPNVFYGGNLNLVDNSGRVDNVHLNSLGQTQSAQIWDSALTNSFFSTSVPLTPQTPPPANAALTVKSGKITQGDTWFGWKRPKPINRVIISTGHSLTVDANRILKVKSISQNGQLIFESNTSSLQIAF